MKTSVEVDSLLADPQSVPPAANEEFADRSRPSSGWDPYEVWRTRIKAAQDDLKSTVVLSS
jgi:hypothetical protein